MAINITLFENFSSDIFKGVHNLVAAGDELKIMLTNVAPDHAANTVVGDITEISPGNGYVAGGVDVENTVSATGGVVTIDGVSKQISASGGNVGPARWVVLANATKGVLVGSYDTGAPFTIVDGGDPFQFNVTTDLLTISSSGGNLTLFDVFAEDLVKATHDFQTAADVIKVALTNVAPDHANDAVFADITEIAAGNGYAAGGVDILNSLASAGGTATLNAISRTIAASGGNVGPARYAVLHNSTKDRLIGTYDNGAEFTIVDGGDPFEFNVPTNIMTLS